MKKTGVINPKRDDCIWYHSTPNERVESILKNGLKINSKPTWQSKPEPWIYVSTTPFDESDGTTTFEVDLSELPWDMAGWPFDSDWQLRVFCDIPTKWLKEQKNEQT